RAGEGGPGAADDGAGTAGAGQRDLPGEVLAGTPLLGQAAFVADAEMVRPAEPGPVGGGGAGQESPREAEECRKQNPGRAGRAAAGAGGHGSILLIPPGVLPPCRGDSSFLGTPPPAHRSP